jgi:hypothetical protein
MDVALEATGLLKEKLKRLLDPLTLPGDSIHGE